MNPSHFAQGLQKNLLQNRQNLSSKGIAVTPMTLVSTSGSTEDQLQEQSLIRIACKDLQKPARFHLRRHVCAKNASKEESHGYKAIAAYQSPTQFMITFATKLEIERSPPTYLMSLQTL
eukprot:IDg17314t1